ncbi:hypothetical protein [Luteimonas saliphila]|uniref:hypothetical protein n=1 Tax=Luteimonas saliphila TaxID=2804919 RepID=UPI00192DD6BB|nr:hypothetical protein [Luteimonas saliphila]
MSIRARDNRTVAIDFAAAMEARDLGVQRAAEHANRVESEWTGQALGMLIAFASEQSGPFLIEEARAWAEARGLPEPPDKRSWGSVARSAASKRHIVKDGFGSAASSNCSPKVRWRRVQVAAA